ncbi:MAG: hypothetical protein GY836_00005, partial [Herbaspirillum sp.]|uniref:hypothetical protein n=1 Tax=Herbaspirillum sp. TaxID=1890675 RepID=UPI002590A734
QLTVGESYNLIYDGSVYTTKTVGTYISSAYAEASELGIIDGFGTVRETITEGDSMKMIDRPSDPWITTGSYITTAQNDTYGTLKSQLTVGESYNLIYDGSVYTTKTVGSYISSAYAEASELGIIDGFGTVRETITEGDSMKMIDRPSDPWITTGSYVTTAQNDTYGTLKS